MIDKKVYDLDYIRELQARYKTDPGLLERVLYAFGLLEALVKVGMKFTFKGWIIRSGCPQTLISLLIRGQMWRVILSRREPSFPFCERKRISVRGGTI